MESNVVSVQLNHSKIGDKGKNKKVSSPSFFDILFSKEKTSKNDSPTATVLTSKKDGRKDKLSENFSKIQNIDSYAPLNMPEVFIQIDKNVALSAKDNKKINRNEVSIQTKNDNQNHRDIIVVDNLLNQEKIKESVIGKKIRNKDLLNTSISIINSAVKEPKIREDIKPKLKELSENLNYEILKNGDSFKNLNIVNDTVSMENNGLLRDIKLPENKNLNVSVDTGQSGQNQIGLVNLVDVKSSDNYSYDQSFQNQGQNNNQGNTQTEINQNSKFNLTFNYLDTRINIQSINNSMVMYLTTDQHLNPQIIQNIQRILTENGINNHNLVIKDKTKVTKVYSSKVNINDSVKSDGFRISA
ncbi:MAG: hypothetical protein ABWJ98_06505 [Hydrogenothermaceae bacterium]